jgi:DNA repair protein RadC
MAYMLPSEIIEYKPLIRDLPVDLRPRERMLYADPGALSTAELLAIILRVGGWGENVIRMAERLLAQFGGVAGLAQANFDELYTAHGIGEAKATQIKNAPSIPWRHEPRQKSSPETRLLSDVNSLPLLYSLRMA